jgi:release factor glutamine methyltransferase
MATPRLDAELLAAHALGLSRMALYTGFDRPLDDAELTGLRGLVKRRLAGEPVAYITGHKEFWSLDLLVDARVLVPRPDTETLVEAALERLPADRPARLADIGTGSGAIALALAAERPLAQVVATDASTDALVVATANAERVGVTERVRLLHGDLLAPLGDEAAFDVIVSNPPYIPTADVAGLAAEVRREPRVALDGGADGLAIVRRLIDGAPAPLAVEGWLLIEVGAGQADAAVEHFWARGYRDVSVRRDLSGIARAILGRRPA